MRTSLFRLSLGGLLLALPGVQGGCTRAVFFDAPVPLSDGVRGRFWQNEQSLEFDPGTPLVDSAGRSTFGFDFAVNAAGTAGTLVFTAATSQANTHRVPVQRRFDSEGFASAGPNFSALSATPASYSFASVVPGPEASGGAEFFAVFTQGTTLVTHLSQADGWSAGLSRTGLIAPLVSSASDFRLGPPVRGVFDVLGRGFFQLVGSAATWQWLPYEPGHASAFGTAVSTPTGVDARVVADGEGRVLSLNLTSGGALSGVFADPFTGSVTSGVTAVTLAASGARGMAAASDGVGEVVIVANESGSLRAWRASDGVLSGSAVSIAEDVGTWASGTRASIVYLGRRSGSSLGARGKFLASWIRTSGGMSDLWSAVFDLASGSWSAPERVGSSEGFVSAPHHVSVRLETSGAGDALLLVNHLRTENTTALDHVWDVLASRFNADSGWLEQVVLGQGCSGDLVCSHLPAGGVLRSGDSVVVFPDQDSLGQYRLRSQEFRK
jgi:hypothetical protein